MPALTVSVLFLSNVVPGFLADAVPMRVLSSSALSVVVLRVFVTMPNDASASVIT